MKRSIDGGMTWSGLQVRCRPPMRTSDRPLAWHARNAQPATNARAIKAARRSAGLSGTCADSRRSRVLVVAARPLSDASQRFGAGQRTNKQASKQASEQTNNRRAGYDRGRHRSCAPRATVAASPPSSAMPRQCVRHRRLHPTESCRFGSACGRLPGMVADGVWSVPGHGCRRRGQVQLRSGRILLPHTRNNSDCWMMTSDGPTRAHALTHIPTGRTHAHVLAHAPPASRSTHNARCAIRDAQPCRWRHHLVGPPADAQRDQADMAVGVPCSVFAE